jgi:8-oxo-dGTP pyrophosphatase MutT (NUDIX family)
MKKTNNKQELNEILESGFNPQTHGSVGVIVKKSNGKYLIMRRALDDTDGPGLFDIPGGTPDHQNEIEEAAKRELMEEAGIDAQELELFAYDKYICPWNNEEKLFFSFVHEIGEEEDATISFEHHSHEWIDPEDLEKYEFYKPNAKALLQAFIEHDRNQNTINQSQEV